MSIMRHGHTVSTVTEMQWAEAKGFVKMLLIMTAKGRHLITYGELSDQVQRVLDIEIDRHLDMGYLVGELSENEYAAGRHMMSAIVVKAEDQTPGMGFFECADMLGVVYTDRTRMWGSEVRAVHELWHAHILRMI